jgi:hypothetical protein
MEIQAIRKTYQKPVHIYNEKGLLYTFDYENIENDIIRHFYINNNHYDLVLLKNL